MNAQIKTLQAEILADMEAIAEIYATLDHYADEPASEEQRIALAYYLHNLYCAFESIFQRIAHIFENQISDQASWHTALLHRMRLDIDGIRPHVLSGQAYDNLDELRRFRHLFRSAYRLRIDADRLALVHKKAQALQKVYQTDLEHFLTFLDTLLTPETL